jgi:SNF2 family DNA or RNA helicase
MGLGKTLTMIALVAADSEGYNAGNLALEESECNIGTTKATLIVVPPPRKY